MSRPSNEDTQSTATPAADGEVRPGSGLGAESRESADSLPDQIGRYQVLKLLGEGGFGRVYLAHDDQLRRNVAVKVPRPERIRQASDVDAFLFEARALAGLDHPHIVPVHDAGPCGDGSAFVVSKYVEGRDLSSVIAEGTPPLTQTIDWVIAVAEALHYAHTRGLVHRDIKPGNILIDSSGRPVVVDFGLALRDEDVGGVKGMYGTPAYMSPEQARGEGHRVDGRSDVYSLAVVFYELLTGRRPFRARSLLELREQIVSMEPRPPRQFVDSIPKEVERICLRALAKRASDRYSTAIDFADDLRAAASSTTVTVDVVLPDTALAASADSTAIERADAHGGGLASANEVRSGARASSGLTSLHIVPKGLRSFDSRDADFFLELLPGPRDRAGLPDLVRRWKLQIEETREGETFATGLIYGPSGCGKSSLVKAGLLPRLASHVLPIYLEAGPQETESRLLNALRKQCPGISSDLSLTTVFAMLRRGDLPEMQRKVLIVLDQFEQWLHACPDYGASELVAAIRQCDGGSLQCIVMVRDDFWMSVTRFMRELEVRVVEGENSAPVDLFPLRHARNVLAAYGRAYGALSERSDGPTVEEKEFLEQAVAALAEDGQVISVRLALFAEMMKNRPWTSAALKAVGGMTGLGVTFLESTFSSRTAPPEHRVHQEAVRSVLAQLLPKAGVDIKGNTRTRAELLAASGYARRPGEFERLMEILDRELRLVTPTELNEPRGEIDIDVARAAHANPETLHYQLTHDYLVLPLREWLTAKQRETATGRAELRLAELAAAWSIDRENRHLPSLIELIRIVCLSPKRRWSDVQRRMLARAGLWHGARWAMVLAAVALGGWSVGEWRKREQVRAAVDSLLVAEPAGIPSLVARLNSSGAIAEHMLRERLASASDSRKRLAVRLALASKDERLLDELRRELLEQADPQFLKLIIAALSPKADVCAEELWGILQSSDGVAANRFRAALALASFEPASSRWYDADCEFVVRELLRQNPEQQPALRELLRPLRKRLANAAESAFANAELADSERVAAANLVVDFLHDEPDRLARLSVLADSNQFKILFKPLEEERQATVEVLTEIARTAPEVDWTDDARILRGRKRAHAAAGLLRLGLRDSLPSALRFSDDLEAPTQFARNFRGRGIGPSPIVESIGDCAARRAKLTDGARRVEDGVLYGLLLALGEFKLDDLTREQQSRMLQDLEHWYRDDPSAAVHGAAGWLLRRWGREEDARRIDSRSVPFDANREWFTVAVRRPAGSAAGATSGEAGAADAAQSGRDDEASFHFTFVVIPAGTYAIGSPLGQAEREDPETPHTFRLVRPIAVLDREVTRAEFLASGQTFDGIDKFWNTIEHPILGANWYEAVRFCRWLTTQTGIAETEQAYPDPASLDVERYPRESLLGGTSAPRDWPVNVERTGLRLPMEAEFEIASRAGAATKHPFGSDTSCLDAFAWHEGNSAKKARLPRALRPNALGLFDLQGNAAEWCHDWQRPYAVGDDAAAVTGDTAAGRSQSERVIRGGAWYFAPVDCRPASRRGHEPTGRSLSLGFRVVMTLPGGERK